MNQALIAVLLCYVALAIGIVGLFAVGYWLSLQVERGVDACRLWRVRRHIQKELAKLEPMTKARAEKLERF